MNPYKVLARKWRPQNFHTLVGQDHVARSLRHALANNRLAHGYLFTGIRGVGKTTVARILAKSMICQTGILADPCDHCENCLAVTEGRHPDVLEIDAASRTKVEQMREILDAVGYAPTMARFKIYLLDEVHMLSASSFNALLKTLEEPPGHVKFLFATTEPRKIPATILSRCQRYDLRRVALTELSNHLANILREEQIPFEEEGVTALAQAAEGSVRDALSMLDQVIAHGEGSVREASVRQLLGLTDPAAVAALLDSVVQGRGAAILQACHQFHENGYEPVALLNGLLERIHGLAREMVTTGKGPLPLEHWQMLYQVLLRGKGDVTLADSPLQALEMVLLRAAYLKPVPSLEQLIRTLEGRGGGRVAGGSPATANGPPASWEGVVAAAMENSPPLATKLGHQVICLSFQSGSPSHPPSLVLQQVNDLFGPPEKLARELSQFMTQRGWQEVQIRVEPPTVGNRPETLVESRQRQLDDQQRRLTHQIENSPLFHTLDRRFQARIVRVDPR